MGVGWNKPKHGHELSRVSWQFGLAGVGIWLFLFVSDLMMLGTAELHAAESKIDWLSVEPDIRDQAQAITRSVSEVFRVQPHQVSYQRNGSERIQYLSSQCRTSWKPHFSRQCTTTVMQASLESVLATGGNTQ